MRLCLHLFGIVAFAGAALGAAPAEPSSRIRLVVRSDARTGRLVRSVVTPKPAAGASAAQLAAPLRETIDRIARENNVDPQLVHSVIRVESNFNPYAVSHKGAQGLMQLIPATARRFGVANVFNPVENIEGGVKYLKHLLELHGGNFQLALAAYNAGEGAVAQHGGIPPYPETRRYVDKVSKHWGEVQRQDAEQQELQARAGLEAPASPRLHNEIHELVDANGRVTYISR